MRKVTNIGTWIAVCSLAVGIAAASATPEETARIRELRETWIAAVNSQNLDGLVDLYAEGAVIMPSYVAPQLGRDVIRGWYDAQFRKFETHYDYAATELRVEGGSAFERWTLRMTFTPAAADSAVAAGDAVQFTEDGVRVYRRVENGDWKIDREYWSGDHAAAEYLKEMLSSACPAHRC